MNQFQQKLPAEMEQQRLQVLHSYDILDTEPEPTFDHITKLAARLARVNISLVSLVDRDRQFFKSTYGANVREMPRELSFCEHAIAEPSSPLIISDAIKDERVKENPLVAGPPFIRFYAGFPILDKATGLALGTLCVIDNEVRTLTEDQHENIQGLAKLVEDELQLRIKNRELRQFSLKLEELYQLTQGEIEDLRQNLIQIITHELRTPLNAMVGASDFLNSEWETLGKEDIKEMLRLANHGCSELTSKVERLSLFSELKIHNSFNGDGSNFQFPAGICSIPEAVDQAIASLDSVLPEHGREQDFDIRVSPSWTAVPEDRLACALRELLANAINYSPAGTPISVVGHGTTDGYSLSVSDRGSGILPNQRSRIGAFIQFDRKKREQQGFGLGLVIVQQLGLIYQFSLALSKNEGAGTTATLSLPLLVEPGSTG
ncbi:MAG: GAF domain-containing sensor histidine kinase [Opitutales bacterium]